MAGKDKDCGCGKKKSEVAAVSGVTPYVRETEVEKKLTRIISQLGDLKEGRPHKIVNAADVDDWHDQRGIQMFITTPWWAK